MIDRAAIGRAPRLLWVNHFAVAPDMGGGTRHFEMGRELVQRGWSVTIAASDFHLHGRTYMRRASGDRSPRIETLEGVQFAWLWAAPYESNDARRVWNWVSFSRSLTQWASGAERPDIVVGSTPHLFAALAAWLAARRHGVPFVLEVRDLWPESLAVGGGRRGPAYWSLHALARFLYRVADRIIVLAPGVGDFLARRAGVAPERIVLAPNGVDVAAYAGMTRPPRTGVRLAYTGAHGPANGLEAVLDAAALLRDDPRVAFDLIGDGPSKPELVKRARLQGLDNVRFREPIGKTAIPTFLAECDAGLMVLKDVPLFAFGVSPNKLFDYWGASLPVISNVPGEVADMVRQSGAGIQSRDASGEALADAIRRLVALPPAERAAMGGRGRAWVERERDRPILTARMDAALRRLIEANP